jgi:hypothetical protein
MVYRRGPEEMVVDEEEQHETRFEGSARFFSSVEVVEKDGKVPASPSSGRASAR